MRREFSKMTKLLAFKNSGGVCAGCGCKLFPGGIFYENDHDLACGLGGDNSLGNCVCLCKPCHKTKTRSDVALIAKAKRRELKHAGIRNPRTMTAWRRFDGSIRRVERER